MKILWTEPARMDLREIFLYISNDNPKAARVLLDTIKKRVALLKENPRLGRLGRVKGLMNWCWRKLAIELKTSK
jgi:toxin ParE1/3/4